MSSTSSVAAIENTPSLNASMRVVLSDPGHARRILARGHAAIFPGSLIDD